MECEKERGARFWLLVLNKLTDSSWWCILTIQTSIQPYTWSVLPPRMQLSREPLALSQLLIFFHPLQGLPKLHHVVWCAAPRFSQHETGHNDGSESYWQILVQFSVFKQHQHVCPPFAAFTHEQQRNGLSVFGRILFNAQKCSKT
jgi:hypothetical protein